MIFCYNEAMERKELIVAPSLLSGDFSNAGEAIEKINKTSAEWIHFDVMDGSFVLPITFGAKMIEDCRSLSSKFFDVHLMVIHPLAQIKLMIDAGADCVTFHFEACEPKKIESLISEIRAYKPTIKVGIALNPKTPYQEIIPFLDKIDLVLVMSVFPGYGGQSFMVEVLEKIARFCELKKEKGLSFLISVDGGINLETAGLARNAGVEVLVSGSAFFKETDSAVYVKKLKEVY